MWKADQSCEAACMDFNLKTENGRFCDKYSHINNREAFALKSRKEKQKDV